jgi:hypothetical protein
LLDAEQVDVIPGWFSIQVVGDFIISTEQYFVEISFSEAGKISLAKVCQVQVC